MEYASAVSVEPLPGNRLLVTFDSGEQKVFDLTPYLEMGVFKELRDAALFNSVRIAFDTVEWANGADLCPEVLYHESRLLSEPLHAE